MLFMESRGSIWTFYLGLFRAFEAFGILGITVCLMWLTGIIGHCRSCRLATRASHSPTQHAISGADVQRRSAPTALRPYAPFPAATAALESGQTSPITLMITDCQMAQFLPRGRDDLSGQVGIGFLHSAGHGDASNHRRDRGARAPTRHLLRGP